MLEKLIRMEVKDIIDDTNLILELTRRAVIEDSNLKLVNNYKDFEKRIDNYRAFHIVEHNGKVLSFSGVYNDPTWPDNIVRVVDRFFTFPKYRVKNMNGYSDNKGKGGTLGGLGSQQMLPLQTKLAHSQGLTPFVSRQDIRKKRGFMKWLVERIDPELGYNMLPNLHYTCGGEIKYTKDCWQMIISTGNIDLPAITFDMYKELI